MSPSPHLKMEIDPVSEMLCLPLDSTSLLLYETGPNFHRSFYTPEKQLIWAKNGAVHNDSESVYQNLLLFWWF
jgi:hypothetical protein